MTVREWLDKLQRYSKTILDAEDEDRGAGGEMALEYGLDLAEGVNALMPWIKQAAEQAGVLDHPVDTLT